MEKAVVFDLFDTLVKVDSMDFTGGLALLYERYMSDACSFDEVKAYNEISFRKYIERHRENREYPLMKEEIPDYLARFGIDKAVEDAGFEWEFMKRSGTYSVADEVEDVLEELSRRGVYMYVLSNSIYSGDALRKLLDSFGILKYFRQVFSSADQGISKPAAAFFDVAIEAVQKDIPGIERKDIVFTGDRYDLDAAGACGAGMRAVWLNHKGEENTDFLPVRGISRLSELPGIVFRERSAASATA